MSCYVGRCSQDYLCNVWLLKYGLVNVRSWEDFLPRVVAVVGACYFPPHVWQFMLELVILVRLQREQWETEGAYC